MELNLWFICKDCGQKGISSELICDERCPNCASENIKLKFFDDSNSVVDYVLHCKKDVVTCEECVHNRCYLNCYCQSQDRVKKMGTSTITNKNYTCEFFKSNEESFGDKKDEE